MAPFSRSDGESLSPFGVFGYTVTPSGSASQEPPFPRRALSHTVRVSAPEAWPLASLCLSGRPWAPAQSRGWVEGAFAPLSRSAASPGAEREPPAPLASSLGWVSEPEGDIDPSRLHALTCWSPRMGWLLTPSGPSFSLSLPPGPSSRLPPPAGWAPPPLLPDCSPARPQLPSGVVLRVHGGNKAGRGGGEQAGQGT